VSLLLYMVVYLIVYPTGLIMMLRLVWAGPSSADQDETLPVSSGLAQAPVQALPAAGGRTS
jgi:cytochrome d ubiquinol oxidase subunit I